MRLNGALKRPAREPRPPARRAYVPEGTEEKPPYPALLRDQLRYNLMILLSLL